jgi:hypothetical protein
MLMMKGCRQWGVSRRALMVIGGVVWTAAGANILRIGVNCWMAEVLPVWLKALGAASVFAAFYCGVFSKMHTKHSRRISLKPERNCPFGFLDVRGWAIMAFMIALGVTIRRFELMPQWFIAMFYTGLSSALMLTGLRFLLSGLRFNRQSCRDASACE